MIKNRKSRKDRFSFRLFDARCVTFHAVPLAAILLQFLHVACGDDAGGQCNDGDAEQ